MEKKLMVLLLTIFFVCGFAGPGISYMSGDHGFHNNENGTGYSHAKGHHYGHKWLGQGLKDKNNDGYCDGTGIHFQDLDDDGIHDGYHGRGIGFVDEDGNGICDRTGMAFIDEDGDEICDNCGKDRNLIGYRGKGRGNGTRNGIPFTNILDGTPFVYSGEVVGVGFAGSGTVVETENGDVTIHGLGPLWFWECIGAFRPVAGDLIDVNGYTVDYNDNERTIAVSITIDGQTVDLRDLDSGAPLWRGSRRACQ
ncbi:MAG: hypothetical protein GY868_14890 [Deltaproteobacteria bacterium]|nr:hypothetical protein [Deltaproteobacteria bacterium]